MTRLEKIWLSLGLLAFVLLHLWAVSLMQRSTSSGPPSLTDAVKFTD